MLINVYVLAKERVVVLYHWQGSGYLEGCIHGGVSPKIQRLSHLWSVIYDYSDDSSE